MTKRVVVSMPDDCHRALKQYAAFMGINMGDVIYELCKSQLHKQALSCEFTSDVLNKTGVELDKRVQKPCYGWRCLACTEEKACRVGIYGGVHLLPDKLLKSGLATKYGMRELDKLQIDSGQTPQFNYKDR